MRPSILKIFTLILLASLTACAGVTAKPPENTATAAITAPAVTSTTPATSTLDNGLTLGYVGTNTISQKPPYMLKADVPVLQGSDNPSVMAFNKAAAALAQKLTDDYKQNAATMIPATPIVGGSYFDLSYKLVLSKGQLISLDFNVEGYTDGSAHPYHTTASLNFDLSTGQEISLASLFRPGANYLQTLSDDCKTVLSARAQSSGYQLFAEGLAPKPENYQTWNLGPDGLVIVFNEYQVAPYFVGAQLVVIPYNQLQIITNPQGPLAQFK